MRALAILALAFAFSCGPKEKEPVKAPTEVGDTTIVAKPDDAQNSLEYLGRYKGSIPKAAMTLELSENFSYLLTTSPDSTKTTAFMQGTFRWNSSGNAIELLSGQGKVAHRFFVGDGFVVMLDASGVRLNAKNSGDFVLAKQNEAQAARSDGTPTDALPKEIAGIHWKLSEVNGKLVKNESAKDYFIEFNTDGRFSAFAGCNRISGKYGIYRSKLQTSDVISTMTACPDIKFEDQFKKALEAADNFVANEKVLQLRKGGANLLKFDAYDIPKP